jgi:GntR family transcriptional regulator, transcriptional repressor for pyruvate dehydrogenase complex
MRPSTTNNSLQPAEQPGDARVPGGEHADPTLFVPVEGPGGPGQIVEQVLTLLRSNVLRAGDQLPPERELAAALRASRSTTREALRILQARGLLEVRVGARGGAFLAAPTSDHAVQGFLDLLTSRGVSVTQVTEARAVVEVAALPLSCARATAEDIAELRALAERDQRALAEGSYQEAYSVAFHARLARCAHNPVIDTMLESMRDVLLASLAVTQRAPAMDRHRGLDEHRLIVDAVERGDPDRAVTILRQHLHRTVERAAEPGC